MTIDESLNIYGNYLKNIGLKHSYYIYVIKRFATHIGPQTHLDDIQTSQCVEYLYGSSTKEDGVTSYWFSIYSVLNGLFKWAILRSYTQQNPLPLDMPNAPKAFVPYIYSKDELILIFSNARMCKSQPFIMYSKVTQTILRITYFLGLRPSETLKLCLCDIFLGQDNYAIIRETKYYKSRIVPFNKQVALTLKEYLKWRLVNNFPANPDSSLFLTRKQKVVPLYAIRITFKEICKESGIYRDDNNRFGPRIYDLRHTFATNRVISWYKEGKDIQVLLPILSTYMGHAKLQSTACYIHFTDELLREASDKFESYINPTHYEK